TSGTNATIALNNANLLSGAVSLNTSGSGGNASLTNNVATQLAASNVGGNLTVVSTLGNLTQSGALTVSGTSSFTTSGTNATITLTNASNALSGAVSLNTSGSSGNASLTNNVATQLAASVQCRQRTDGDRRGWQPDAERGIDGWRDVELRHLSRG